MTYTVKCGILSGVASQRRRGTSYYLTDDCRESLRRLADHYGLSMAAVIEVAVRTLESALESEAAALALTRWIEEGRLGDGDASPRQGGRPPKSA